MYQVEGYAFETKEQEHTAKHEVEIIGYIRKNTRMDDPDIVLALYNKLVLKEIFVTPVGYDFLHRLQEYPVSYTHLDVYKRQGVYPYPLKRRIMGNRGHLSNERSGQLLCELLHDKFGTVVLGHLSKENNYEELAYEAVRLEVTMGDNPYKADEMCIRDRKYQFCGSTSDYDGNWSRSGLPGTAFFHRYK